MEDKVIKVSSLRGKNTRISIVLKYNKESDAHYYLVQSRRLTNIKLRQINKVETVYSVETFTVLMEVGFVEFLNDPLIRNKVLHREISKIDPFKGSRYLTEELR